MGSNKLLSKEVLLILNVVCTPIIAFFGWSLTNYLIPETILINGGGFLETVLRAIYASIAIAILSFLVLVISGRDSLKSILIYTLAPIFISAILAPILIPAVGMLIYMADMYRINSNG